MPVRDAGLPFWAACRRWFWPFLRLSLLGGVLVLVAGVVGVVAARLLRPIVGPDGMAVLQLVLQAIVLGWLELSRALMVAESKRSVGAALGRAARLAMRPLVLVLWLLIWLPGAALFVAALMPPAVGDPYAPLELVRALRVWADRGVPRRVDEGRAAGGRDAAGPRRATKLPASLSRAPSAGKSAPVGCKSGSRGMRSQSPAE